MKLITEQIFDSISEQAKTNSRLRMNYNLHDSSDAMVQRLLNALEPDTYIVPHRHKNPDKTETYIVMRGSLLVAFFDDEGNITEKTELNPDKGIHGLEIPPGVWHSLVALESGTIILEIKEGPYEPLPDDNIAPWAPDVSDISGIKKIKEDIIYFNS